DSHQPSQPSADHAQHFERNLRMRQAECMKVLLTDKQQRGVVDRGHRGRVVPAIEDWHLGDGTAWPVNAEYLLASAGRALEDADVSGLDHVESRARLAFAENSFARREVTRHSPLRQESELRFSEPREHGDLRQRLSAVNLDFRHSGYCTEPGRLTSTGAENRKSHASLILEL